MSAAAISNEEKIERWRKATSRYMLPEEQQEAEQLVREILRLKEEKNAVILGHNYMTPDVYYGISDFTGDSLELARKSAETNADIILFNGVHFMAETAKILNPTKKVLIADLKAGCSLAESMTAADARALRKQYPGVPIVSYINCTAELKAEVDVICTSGNAVKIVESLESGTVIVVPDGYLAGNIQKNTKKKILTWAGKCMVHELYTPTDVSMARKLYPKAEIIAHPECKTAVTELVDYTGSTSQMGKYIADKKPSQVLLLTECSMGDNLRSNFPEVEFVSSCQTCPHMKKITLKKIKEALEKEIFEIHLPEEIIAKGKKSLTRMLELSN